MERIPKGGKNELHSKGQFNVVCIHCCPGVGRRAGIRAAAETQRPRQRTGAGRWDPGRGAIQGLQGHHQARRPRFQARLGAVHAEEGARRAHRTSCSSSTTTPAWPPGRPTAAGSTCRRSTSWRTNGLTYTQWHTAALCSPTRSTLLTGRNHHVERHGRDHGGRQRLPRRRAAASRRRPPPSRRSSRTTATAPSGWARTTTSPSRTSPRAASRKTVAARQMGFDRFYGFLGGETNQWYPDLVEDNRFIEPPYGPEQGYHLSKDLADQAIKMIRDQKASNPSKPWFMWYNPGANHAPHHAPQEYIDKYKGKFDDGYEAYRDLGAGAHDREGRPAEGHEADADQPAAGIAGESGRRGAPVEYAQRRREEALLAHGRGLRRVLGVHRRAGRPHHRLPGEVRAARQHHRLLRRRQRHLRRRHARTARSTRTSSSTATRTIWPRT